jgi:hypothetical protein
VEAAGDAGCTTGNARKADGLNLPQNERISNRGAAALAALTNLKALNLSNTASTPLHFVTFGSPAAPLRSAVAMVSKTELGSTIFRMDYKSKCLRLNSSSQERHGYFPCG